MFSGTCSGVWQRVGQRQLGAVAFLAALFAAFLAVLEQLPLSAADIFFLLPPHLVHGFPKAAGFQHEL